MQEISPSIKAQINRAALLQLLYEASQESISNVALGVTNTITGINQSFKNRRLYTSDSAKSKLDLNEMTHEKFIELATNKFTGKIQGKLKCGDDITLEYEKGILQKSIRNGRVNFEKIYKIVDGERIVIKTSGSKTTGIIEDIMAS